MKFFTTIVLIMTISVSTFAQQGQVTQTLRGFVIDAIDDLALEGATVYLLPLEGNIGTITDHKGAFRFDSIPIGRYQLQVTYVGYKTVIMAEVLVESGKETVKTIALELGTENLKEITVVAGRPKINNLSVQTITVEQTQRYAATFYDPARLVSSFAGVINQNDQGNSLVVRGNAPSSTSWWLEGAEIVNPNHTANAGTASDRVMQSGGGVNILSAQLLGDSYFFKGNYPTQYGNGLGGIFDMRLRKGNNEKHEYTAQVGLIGLDFAAEGPFNKEYEASYLINYRYSTLGLLNKMGVQLGDEAVSFQDLSFNVSLPTENLGNLNIFGMGGSSQNTFEAQRDSTLWKYQKDRQDIYFTSSMGALGFSHDVPFADKALLKTTFILSSATSTRNAYHLDDDYTRKETDRDYRQETKISFSSKLQVRLNEQQRLIAGLTATQYTPIVRTGTFLAKDSVLLVMEGFTQNWLYRPYTSWEFRPISQLQINVGAGFSYYNTNGTSAFEPLIAVSYDFKKNQSVSFSYRIQSKIQAPTVYFGADILSNKFIPSDTGAFGYNARLEMTKSQQLGLAYKTSVLKKYNIEAELYYQQLYNVPIIDKLNSTFSTLNLLDEIIQDTLKNKGTGRNYGIEVMIQKFMENGYYLLLSATIYESKYTAGDGIERDTRFNGNYGMVLSGGKEFQFTKREKKGIIGVNAKVLYIGGFRVTPINYWESYNQNQTIFIDNQAFTEQYPDYFKVDFRIYYKQNHKKYSSTLALDIQNLTNAQNPAFDYFDVVQKAIVRKYQLGTIPMLMYRVEF